MPDLLKNLSKGLEVAGKAGKTGIVDRVGRQPNPGLLTVEGGKISLPHFAWLGLEFALENIAVFEVLDVNADPFKEGFDFFVLNLLGGLL